MEDEDIETQISAILTDRPELRLLSHNCGCLQHKYCWNDSQLVETSGPPLGAPAEEQAAKHANEESPPGGGCHGDRVTRNGWMVDGGGQEWPLFFFWQDGLRY